jgi:formylglycine-generating enzyme required for sulfatase activity
MVQIPPEEEAEQAIRFSFNMGSAAADKDSDFIEFPQHPVVIGKPFNLGRYEVTFDEYLIFAYLIESEGGCPDNHKIDSSLVLDENWGRGTRPAINVSWNDANCYAQWLSKKTGAEIPYRLPTEAEWEFAARAGAQTRYWWGPDIKEQMAVCDGCMSDWSGKSEKKQTAEVDDPAFEPNPWGLYHISGNTWEWVEDCWHENYNGAPGDGSAWESENNGNCSRRVLRGGSWVDTPVGLRSAHRYKLNNDYRYYNVGFRLARD